MKFLRRKDCGQIISVKKYLKKVKMHNIGLTGNRFMFIKHAYAPITKCCGQNVRGFMSWVILQTFTFLVLQ